MFQPFKPFQPFQIKPTMSGIGKRSGGPSGDQGEEAFKRHKEEMDMRVEGERFLNEMLRVVRYQVEKEERTVRCLWLANCDSVGEKGEVEREAMRRMVMFVGGRQYEAAMKFSGFSKERMDAIRRADKLNHLPPSIAEAMNTSTTELELDGGEGELKDGEDGECEVEKDKEEEKEVKKDKTVKEVDGEEKEEEDMDVVEEWDEMDEVEEEDNGEMGEVEEAGDTMDELEEAWVSEMMEGMKLFTIDNKKKIVSQLADKITADN